MSMERREALLNKMGVGPDSDVLYIVSSSSNTSDTMEVFEQVVIIDTDTNDQAFTLYLPPVGAAKGKIYTITLIDAGATVTVADLDDSLDWSDINDLDADNDGVVLFSDGLKWWVLLDDVA